MGNTYPTAAAANAAVGDGLTNLDYQIFQPHPVPQALARILLIGL